MYSKGWVPGSDVPRIRPSRKPSTTTSVAPGRAWVRSNSSGASRAVPGAPAASAAIWPRIEAFSGFPTASSWRKTIGVRATTSRPVRAALIATS